MKIILIILARNGEIYSLDLDVGIISCPYIYILCNREDIGDEFHYIFECPHFSDDRNKLVPKKYTKTLNSIQFCELFASKGLNLVKLCKFIDKITTVV